MTLRRIVLLVVCGIAFFAFKPADAEAGVYVQVGPGGVYAGPGYGYYGGYRPYYRPYYRPRAYYYPRYVYPRNYYVGPRYYRRKWRRRW